MPCIKSCGHRWKSRDFTLTRQTITIFNEKCSEEWQTAGRCAAVAASSLSQLQAFSSPAAAAATALDRGTGYNDGGRVVAWVYREGGTRNDSDGRVVAWEAPHPVGGCLVRAGAGRLRNIGGDGAVGYGHGGDEGGGWWRPRCTAVVEPVDGRQGMGARSRR
jgi:hypothetical protein